MGASEFHPDRVDLGQLLQQTFEPSNVDALDTPMIQLMLELSHASYPTPAEIAPRTPAKTSARFSESAWIAGIATFLRR